MPDEYWLLVLLGLLMCGSAAAAVAYSKGRSYLGWFMLGALFGPIAILGIAVASPVARQQFGDTSLPDEIAKLAALRDNGTLTDQEYETAKARLLA